MRTRARGWLFVSLQIALIGALVLFPEGDAWRVPRTVRFVGTGGRILGAVSILWGVAALGRRARVHPEPPAGATLRRTGPYRLVRHPIYSGLLLYSAMIVIGSASVVAVALYAALVGVLTGKARFEESLLRARFPEYGQYAQETPRFIPLSVRRLRGDSARPREQFTP